MNLEMAQKIREALRSVIDPEVNQSIVELGLIRSIEVEDEKAVIELVSTSAFCPLAIHIALNAKKEVRKIRGLKDVKIYIRGHVMERMINETLSKCGDDASSFQE
ncbi:MAG: iron-sulfur cluster assembly protein [Nitrososphaerales archaeon]